MGRLSQLKMLTRRRSAASDGGVIVSDADSFSPLDELASILRSEIERREQDSKMRYPHLKEKQLRKRTEETTGLKKLEQRLRYGKRDVVAPFIHQEFNGLFFKETIYSPLGKRHPRITNSRSHITLSWIGDRDYHRAAWHQEADYADNFEYFLQIFFKAGNTAPAEWHATYRDFVNSDAYESEPAWSDLPPNHYIILAKCIATRTEDNQTKLDNSIGSAYLPGDLSIYSSELHACLSPPAPGKWFAFPGVIRDYANITNVSAGSGQLRSILPGDELPYWAPRKVKSEPVRAVFEKSYHSSTAILTKLYPGGFGVTIIDSKAIIGEIWHWVVRPFEQLLAVLLHPFTNWKLGLALIPLGFVAYLTFPLYVAIFSAFLDAVPEILENSGISEQPNWLKLKDLWERLKDFWPF